MDTFESNSNKFYSFEPALIYWLTHSSNLVAWLLRGSRKSTVQHDLFKLIKLLSSLHLSIVPVHVPRDYNVLQLADLGSKWCDTDDWSIDQQSFSMLQEFAEKPVSCDAFAYNTNAKVIFFYSLIPSSGCSGINTFSMNWSHDFLWVCPPVKEIINVLRHIQKQTCSGILIVPNWPTSMFWTKLTIDGKHLLPIFVKHIVFKPFLNKGEHCIHNTFDGVPKFTLIALVFDLSVTGYDKSSENYCIAQHCVKY